jgi:thioredoxin 1
MLTCKQHAMMRGVASRAAARCSTKATRPSLFASQQTRRNSGVTFSAQVEEVVIAQPKEAIRELNKDDFFQVLGEATTLVVVDFYTEWCGPCKMIYPDLVKMANSYEGRVQFTKLNCNKENKEIGVKLKIKVAPTFHLYRNSEKVAEMTGAKVDKLKALIESHL